MDGGQRSKVRRVTRHSEPSRLEEDLWAQVYEQLWPMLQTAFKGNSDGANTRSHQTTIAKKQLTRSA